MDDTAIPPPAPSRSCRIPGLAAAPWALVAVVVAWHFGYSVRRDFVCVACRSQVTELEVGFAVGEARTVSLGKTRTATADPHLVGIVDSQCGHSGGRAAERWKPHLWPASPLSLAMRWWQSDQRSWKRSLAGGRLWSEHRHPLGPPNERIDPKCCGTPAWSDADAFQVATFLRPEFRAHILESVSCGDVTLDDVRWLMTMRDVRQRSVVPTREEQRRIDLARTLLERGPPPGGTRSAR